MTSAEPAPDEPVILADVAAALERWQQTRSPDAYAALDATLAAYDEHRVDIGPLPPRTCEACGAAVPAGTTRRHCLTCHPR